MQPPVRKSRGKGKGQMDDEVLVKFPDKINHKKKQNTKLRVGDSSQQVKDPAQIASDNEHTSSSHDGRVPPEVMIDSVDIQHLSENQIPYFK